MILCFILCLSLYEMVFICLFMCLYMHHYLTLWNTLWIYELHNDKDHLLIISPWKHSRITCYIGLKLLLGSTLFIEVTKQNTLYSLLRTGWFQALTSHLFYEHPLMFCQIQTESYILLDRKKKHINKKKISKRGT